jgi:hypothetical protein
MSGALSSFFILSPRGDTIISRVSDCGAYRGGRGQKQRPASNSNTSDSQPMLWLWHRIYHQQDFRGDSLPNAAEILFRKVKFWEKGDAPPVFHLDGLNFLFVRKNGLLFGATTRFNVSPSTIIELLNRTAKVFKDYCGILSEVRPDCVFPTLSIPSAGSASSSNPPRFIPPHSSRCRNLSARTLSWCTSCWMR